MTESRLHILATWLYGATLACQIDHTRDFCQATQVLWADLVNDGLQRLHRAFDKIRHRPDAHPRLAVVGPQHIKVLAFDLLQTRRLCPQIGEIAVRFEQRNRPCPGNDRYLRIGIFRDQPFDLLIVVGTKLKTLPLPTGVPDQVGQKRLRPVIPRLGRAVKRARIVWLTTRKGDLVLVEKVAVHLGTGRAREPRL